MAIHRMFTVGMETVSAAEGYLRAGDNSGTCPACSPHGTVAARTSDLVRAHDPSSSSRVRTGIVARTDLVERLVAAHQPSCSP